MGGGRKQAIARLSPCLSLSSHSSLLYDSPDPKRKTGAFEKWRGGDICAWRQQAGGGGRQEHGEAGRGQWQTGRLGMREAWQFH